MIFAVFKILLFPFKQTIYRSMTYSYFRKILYLILKRIALVNPLCTPDLSIKTKLDTFLLITSYN